MNEDKVAAVGPAFWPPTPLNEQVARITLKDFLFEEIVASYLASRSGDLAAVAWQFADSIVTTLSAEKLQALGQRDELRSFLQLEGDAAGDMLLYIRSVFHQWHFHTASDPVAMLFELDEQEFAAADKRVAGVTEAELVKARDVLWRHDHGASEAWTGQPMPEKAKYFLKVCMDDLQALATRYCEEPRRVSLALEWALVDALLHTGLVEMGAGYRSAGWLRHTSSAQLASARQAPGHVLMGRPLHHPRPSTGIFGADRFKLLREGGTLLVHSAIAFGFTRLDNASNKAWFVLGAVTISRWLLQLLVAAVKWQPPVNTATDFLWRATQAYEAVPVMNPGLLRHLLYGLVAEGAAFAPEMFDVLDKRQRWLDRA